MENTEEEFVVTRSFDAPQDLVWKAWTDADRLKRWFGPKGFVLKVAELDLRPGGTFHYGLRSSGGQEMWGKWIFREIVPPERLDYLASFADPEGNTVRAPFSDTWPLEVLSTLTLAEQDGRTILTLRAVPHNATEAERNAFVAMFGSMQAGWAGTLDQLEAYLAESGGAS